MTKYMLYLSVLYINVLRECCVYTCDVSGVSLCQVTSAPQLHWRHVLCKRLIVINIVIISIPINNINNNINFTCIIEMLETFVNK